MSEFQAPHADFSRYFALRQRAFLINISEGRDQEQYESLSGSIVSCNGDTIALQIPYATGQEVPEAGSLPVIYKLTSESMGEGIQIMAELVGISANNTFLLRLRGSLEMYQRRQTPRIDTAINLFQIRRDTTLAIYRKEFKRIMDVMNNKGIRPNLALQETPVNLSAGGIRVAFDPQQQISPLSMFFLELEESRPLICAVTELAWCRHEKDLMVCGYRFMQISKTDQERLSRYVLDFQKEQGLAAPSSRTYWELLDRMSVTEPEKR